MPLAFRSRPEGTLEFWTFPLKSGSFQYLEEVPYVSPRLFAEGAQRRELPWVWKKRFLNLNEVVQNRTCRNHYLPCLFIWYSQPGSAGPCCEIPTCELLPHKYLAGISKELDCDPVLVGGVEDHVHLLCRLGVLFRSRTGSRSQKGPSRWLKKQSPELRGFEWQGGYADFGVSVSSLDRVRKYIEDQEVHHKQTNLWH